MRTVKLQPSGDGFKKWSVRANDARDRMLLAWRTEVEAAAWEGRAVNWKPKINDELYREIRGHFFGAAFNQKCAYCEGNHSDGHPVQVEHFRPKKGITEGRKEIDHSGYFWLAYEWWNLLPSCASCNTNHTDPRREWSHPGKKNEFPVGAKRVLVPSVDPSLWQEELKSEDPYLLNPYFDHPEEHIDFNCATGAAIGKTRRGKLTIRICDLRRPSLNDRRTETKTENALGTIFSIMMTGKDCYEAIRPTDEFSLWRIRAMQDEVKNRLCPKFGLNVVAAAPMPVPAAVPATTAASRPL